MPQLGRSRWRYAIRGAAVVLVIGLCWQPTLGYSKYRSASGGACAGCHGDFTGGFSPSGRVFPFDSKHSMHRASSAMNTDCALCHYEGDDLNPDLNRSDSDGFGGTQGFGCLGCHGRDYGGDLGVMGVGLREHHRTVGISSCGDNSCHSNDPAPLPENVSPPYYGSFDTRAWDECNRAPLFGENFTLEEDNHRGLDNDGDNLYDEDDPDCATQACPGDANADGVVDINDLLIVLGEWGACGACAGDVNADGQVDIDDLLIVLGAWGPCP